MSRYVASESNEDHESREISGKRGVGDEGGERGEEIIEASSAANSTTLTTVSTVPATTDQFMFTNDFKRLLVGFVQGDTVMTLRLATKGWKCVADAFIDEGVKSGTMIVHDGTDISWAVSWAREERRKQVSRVIFLLNITKVGVRAFHSAVNLVVVDIPEGIESIDEAAFNSCRSLTTVSFPTTLTWIGRSAFNNCKSLDNVDLLHRNLQELGDYEFHGCSELKSMTIPDSLQTFGYNVFCECFKPVPSSIDVNRYDHDVSAVFAYLRSKQKNN
ncbi:hypothetical protein TL16_g05408 [Triparma laevis f. inornata]|uniref:Uncharacterized protein n=1 Tax=Triparma laevis f. inornata TaxID=1714386 RepID=A0A9W7E940_9STRA|nr:hypothetical protein TL16_g05408 [Triparma laevis f. inornata]